MDVRLAASIPYRRVQYAIQFPDHKPFMQGLMIEPNNFRGRMATEFFKQCPRFRKVRPVYRTPFRIAPARGPYFGGGRLSSTATR